MKIQDSALHEEKTSFHEDLAFFLFCVLFYLRMNIVKKWRMRTGHCNKPVRILHFEDAAYFNHVLDTDKALQTGIEELTAQVPNITEEDYIAGFLILLKNVGIELSEQEFRTLLLLRRRTDQMLLNKEE